MNTNLTALEAFALYILVTSAILHIHVAKTMFARKKPASKDNTQQVSNRAETKEKDIPTPINKPSIIEPVSYVKAKDRVVKVNEHAAEYYLLQSMVNRGMHNLTTKYHKAKKPVT